MSHFKLKTENPLLTLYYKMYLPTYIVLFFYERNLYFTSNNEIH